MEHRITWEEGWKSIRGGITKVKNLLEEYPEAAVTGENIMVIHTAVYNMCTQDEKNPEQLHNGYRRSIEKYINSTVLPCLMEKQDEFLLRELLKRWVNHKLLVRWLSHFLNYLDRFYIPRLSLPTLKEAGLSIFRQLVYEEMKDRVIDAIISLIDREREGEQIDRALLKNVSEFFVEIGFGTMECYQNDFEVAMLQDSASFYSQKASSWIVTDSCTDYMVRIEHCLTLEKDRALHYLHPSSELKLLEKVQHELISVPANQLLSNEDLGCLALLRNGKVDDLSRMFRLFYKVEKGLEPISQIFTHHVTALGIASVKQAEDAVSAKGVKGMNFFFTIIFELYDMYGVYVSDCFQNHYLFVKALKGAFGIFCNMSIAGCPMAELLANFCDSILQKGGNEKLSDEAIESTMEKVVDLLVHISDKDLFAGFSSKKLARRLLFDTSANADHERSFLSKLKRKFGNLFTTNMKGMLNDMTLSKEHQIGFEQYVQCNPHVNPGIDFTVTILTKVNWPGYQFAQLNLPVELAKCVDAFKEFYGTKTRNRRLTWINSLGSCNINATFGNKSAELIVTTQQACVLLLFNDTDRLCCSEITSQLNISNSEAVILLQSLSCGKYKILNKEPNTKSISPTDCFEFNSKFTNRSRRIKVPLHVADEKKKILEDVNRERKYTIDAAIIRIMKSRKVLDVQQLMIECVQQLSHTFRPDVKTIKKRIEDLIFRDFIERDSENSNTIKYLP